MDDIKYFEDAWLELENELSSFQTYQPSSYQNYQSNSSSQENLGDFNETNLDFKTYEQLLTTHHEPTDNEVHSLTTREDRIQAVKDYYNQNPFTIYAKLNKIASGLYKKGMVRQGNRILDKGFETFGHILEKALEKNLAYSKKIGDETRTLTYNQEDSERVYVVSISKEQGPTITGTFDNLQDALEMFYRSLEKED